MAIHAENASEYHSGWGEHAIVGFEAVPVTTNPANANMRWTLLLGNPPRRVSTSALVTVRRLMIPWYSASIAKPTSLLSICGSLLTAAAEIEGVGKLNVCQGTVMEQVPSMAEQVLP